MSFEQAPFDELKRCLLEDNVYGWTGKPVRRFVENLCNKQLTVEVKRGLSNLETLPEEAATKQQLSEMVASEEETVLKVVSILAWGGMQISNCVKALKTYHSDWESVVLGMLDGQHDRYSAYQAFHDLRMRNRLPSMGPAYFTKLIYFLEKEHNGYIMDQWTARSMNLLKGAGERRIYLNKVYTERPKEFSNYYVDTRKNGLDIYISFCERIEALAECLEISPAEAEMLIFSRGDKGRRRTRGQWRDYVLRNG